MKILHTEWSDGLGGQEKRVMAELSGLSERGHAVTLVCRKQSGIHKESLNKNIHVYTLPLSKLYDISSIFGLARFLRERKYDVVNTHSGVDSWIGGIAAKLAKVPVLARTRHLNISLTRNMFNFIHYLPDIYITCGNNMKENLVRNCGFPEDKVVSIPTGVDTIFFNVNRNNTFKAKYGLSPDSKVISNIGILRRVKGHEVTLKSVKYVIDNLPDTKFLIVGNGPRKEILEKTAESLGISDNVIFTGFVEDITEILSFTDIAVLSSWSEGLPQSMLQAMAAGVPVIATSVGGVPEAVIHEKTGILVEPGNHNALAEGIIRLVNDHYLQNTLTTNAKKLVSEDYSIQHMLDDIEALYKNLLLKKNG